MPTRLLDRLKSLRPIRIDAYVASEVIGPFFGGIAFFTFVFLMFQALRLADLLIVKGVPGTILMKIMGLLVLSFLPMALPVAFLIAILIGFGRLSADSELIALKANGVSIQRMAAPIVALSMAVTGLSLALNMEWAPWSDRAFKSLIIRASNTQTKVVSAIKEGTFTTGFYDLLVYADKVDPDTNRLHRVFIYDESEPKNPLTIVAREGEVLTVRMPGTFGNAIMFKLYDGSLHNGNSSSNSYELTTFSVYKIYRKIDEGADNATVKPRMLSSGELSRAVASASPDSQAYREFRTELWRRYAIAMSPLIFAFLGIGFGTVRSMRAVRSGAALIALIVVVLYWSIQATGTVLAHKGYLPPFLAMQLPNLLAAIGAYRGFRSAMW